MNHYATQKSLSEAVDGGGLLVVAQWEAKPGEADKVAAILDRFLPEAQREDGVKLFLISRAKDNPAQFLFYELFRDEAAFKAHQDSAHFKTCIAGEALPLLAKRERDSIRASVSARGGKSLPRKPLPSARSPRTAGCPGKPACPRAHACGRARRSGAASETPCRG